MDVEKQEGEVFEANSDIESLVISLETAEGGGVHLQKAISVRDGGGRSEVNLTHDFLFLDADEFEKWWDNEQTRFRFPDVMVKVKKWVTARLGTQASVMH